MKFQFWLSCVLFLFFSTAVLEAQSRETLLKYVHENPDWTASGNPKLYDENNIDAFAGKSAATLKRYGMIGVTAQDWNGSTGRVRMTLYEMNDASAAYGFFTFQRNPDQQGFSTTPIGTEAFRSGGQTWFWQAKYVVRLEGDEKAAEAFGHVISQNIFGRSRKPPVSDHLPLNNLVQDSEKYVVDAAGVSPQLQLDAAKLGFDHDVEIATARYRVNGKLASLVLLLYPTQQVAKKYEDEWDASDSSNKPFRKRVGPLVAWVRQSDDPGVAEAILNAVNYESKVTWNERRPDISIREVILTIFSFIGIALLFTFVAGVSFGGLRIFVKARYPDRVFDRSADMEIIQLKLDQPLRRKELPH